MSAAGLCVAVAFLLLAVALSGSLFLAGCCLALDHRRRWKTWNADAKYVVLVGVIFAACCYVTKAYLWLMWGR